MPSENPTELSVTQIRDAASAEKYLPSLTALLQACVNEDPVLSSIGFFAPLTDHAATDYWLTLFPAVFAPEPMVTLFVATDPDSSSTVIATVQIARHAKETHTYKGEIRKLLVHPAHRRGGLGRQMMRVAERAAAEDLGLEMLLLDTALETPARDFYLRSGWTEWGICPAYAKFANGRKADCSFFVKMLKD